MICFAAYTPHSPLLIETIGKENRKYLSQSLQAMQDLSDALYASFPDTVLLISSHSYIHEQAFSANLHDEYMIDFQEFGDLSTHGSFLPDLALISAIQKETRDASFPFVLSSQSSLDYGTAVPLLLLTQNRLKPRIVPVTYSGDDRKTHVAFGRLLKEVIKKNHARVAVIASGDLSHCLSSDAPVGYRKEGEEFDQMIRRMIEQMSLSALLGFEQETLEKAAECGFRPLLILFGLLERMQVRPEILSYEHPFGVGYLVAQFHLQ